MIVHQQFEDRCKINAGKFITSAKVECEQTQVTERQAAAENKDRK